MAERRYFYPFLKTEPIRMMSGVGMQDDHLNDQVYCSHQRLGGLYEYVRFQYADRGDEMTPDIRERVEAVIDAAGGEADRAVLNWSKTATTFTLFDDAENEGAALPVFRKLVQQCLANFPASGGTEESTQAYLDAIPLT